MDFRQADLSPRDRAMLEYAAKMARDHHLATQEDVQRLRDVGFADADILHMIFWIAHFNMSNTLKDCTSREMHENITAVFVDDMPTDMGRLGTTAEAMTQTERIRAGWEVAQVRALEGLGLEWINSAALTWADVRGKTVLVVYWDATHPNSLLALPHLDRWKNEFSGRGLTILAAHAAEFPLAKNPAWARWEVRRLGITCPVVLDPTFRKGPGGNNRFWPAIHLIDREGFVRFRHYGPGGFARVGKEIRHVIGGGAEPDAAVDEDSDRGMNPWLHPGATPELYATFYIGARSQVEGTIDAKNGARFPEHPNPHTLYIQGKWTSIEEGVELADGTGQCAFSYRAERVYMLASPGAEPSKVEVYLDGKPVPVADAGPDLRAPSCLVVDAARAYWAIQHPHVQAHRLEVVTQTPGVRIHRFSFLPYRGDVDDLTV